MKTGSNSHGTTSTTDALHKPRTMTMKSYSDNVPGHSFSAQHSSVSYEPSRLCVHGSSPRHGFPGQHWSVSHFPLRHSVHGSSPGHCFSAQNSSVSQEPSRHTSQRPSHFWLCLPSCRRRRISRSAQLRRQLRTRHSEGGREKVTRLHNA